MFQNLHWKQSTAKQTNNKNTSTFKICLKTWVYKKFHLILKE